MIPGKEEEMPGMLLLLVGEKGDELKNERIALHVYFITNSNKMKVNNKNNKTRPIKLKIKLMMSW